MPHTATKLDYDPRAAGQNVTSIAPSSKNEFFEIRPPALPHSAKPIFDETTGYCLGYSREEFTGVWHVYDVTGAYVGIHEAPLEASPIDPLDAIFISLGIVHVVRHGIRKMTKVALTTSTAQATGKFGTGIIAMLRSRSRGVSVQQLKFAAAPARHMAEAGRYVPIHIQHLAIKFGTRTPDPAKVPGVFRYEATMRRIIVRRVQHRRSVELVNEIKDYTLEIVVREADWTILHFAYF